MIVIGYLAENSPETVNFIITKLLNEIQDNDNEFVNIADRKWQDQLSDLQKKHRNILIHNSASYFEKNLKNICLILKSNKNIIVMKQDEHKNPRKFDDIFKSYEINYVFTLLSREQAQNVYYKSAQAGTKFYTMQTGYIDESFFNYDQGEPRYVNRFSYRGSIQPVWLGDYGRDKQILTQRIIDIREKFSEKIIFDISSDWEKRVYGQAWKDLLQRCTGIFGTESGTKIFDIDGRIEKLTRDFEKKYGKISFKDNEIYENYREQVLNQFHGLIDYTYVSPRHIEAALVGRVQILSRGRYQEIFKDGENCLMFDNTPQSLEESIKLSLNKDIRDLMVQNSREAILKSKIFQIQNLLNDVGSILDQPGESKREILHKPNQLVNSIPISSRSFSRCTKNFDLLCSFQFDLDPRHQWWSNWLNKNDFKHRIYEVNVSNLIGNVRSGTKSIKINKDSQIYEVESHTVSSKDLVREIRKIKSKFASSLNDGPKQIIIMLELLLAKGSYRSAFYADLILRNMIFIQNEFEKLKNKTLIVCDFPLALAFSIWREQLDLNYVYDVQEVFPELIPQNEISSAERIIWGELEKFSLLQSNKLVTVSTGIQKFIYSKSGRESYVQPNFVPYQGKNGKIIPSSERIKPIKFVYYGNVFQGKNLDKLIESWHVSANIAELHLFFPENYQSVRIAREFSKKTKINSKIQIYLNSDIPNLIDHLAEYDVGIIPYDFPYPYNHCSPNKFGQYIAAGLAILSSDQEFVSENIAKYGLGEVFNWQDELSIRKSVDNILNAKKLETYKNNSREAYHDFLNWENFSKNLLAFFEEYQPESDRENLNVFFPDFTLQDFQNQACIAIKFFRLNIRFVTGKFLRRVYFLLSSNKLSRYFLIRSFHGLQSRL